MAKHRNSVPKYTALEYAKLKARNGYAMSSEEKRLVEHNEVVLFKPPVKKREWSMDWEGFIS